MTQPLAPPLVLDVVAARITAANPIIVLWYQVPTQRTAYAQELMAQRGSTPLVPVVLRTRLFEHPNAVMEDVRTLIEEQRTMILETSRHGQLALLVLSHTPLAVPQLSSPTVLPDWFPRYAGQLIHVPIEDLAAITVGALSELANAQLAEYLFHLDGALLRRLRAVDTMQHGAGSRFLEYVNQPNRTREKFLSVLVGAERVRRSVHNPADFRPSHDQASITGLFWSAPTTAPSGALAHALGIPDRDVPTYHETLLSVLARPARVRDEPAKRMAYAVAETVCIAAHTITVAHHSDRYPKYPLPLLHAAATDLARSLVSMEAALTLLPTTHTAIAVVGHDGSTVDHRPESTVVAPASDS
jgi:hypothetical protein